MSVLLRAHARTEQYGGGLRLAAVRAAPARLLQLTGAWRHLHCYLSVEHALAGRH
ncbi:hypothetical protein ACBJ59_52115 [Nonomuraea sp. MTCD27]